MSFQFAFDTDSNDAKIIKTLNGNKQIVISKFPGGTQNALMKFRQINILSRPQATNLLLHMDELTKYNIMFKQMLLHRNHLCKR